MSKLNEKPAEAGLVFFWRVLLGVALGLYAFMIAIAYASKDPAALQVIEITAVPYGIIGGLFLAPAPLLILLRSRIAVPIAFRGP